MTYIVLGDDGVAVGAVDVVLGLDPQREHHDRIVLALPKDVANKHLAVVGNGVLTLLPGPQVGLGLDCVAITAMSAPTVICFTHMERSFTASSMMIRSASWFTWRW